MKPGKKPQREWEDEDRRGCGHGSSLPNNNIGKQGRKKEQQGVGTLDARAGGRGRRRPLPQERQELGDAEERTKRSQNH